MCDVHGSSPADNSNIFHFYWPLLQCLFLLLKCPCPSCASGLHGLQGKVKGPLGKVVVCTHMVARAVCPAWEGSCSLSATL